MISCVRNDNMDQLKWRIRDSAVSVIPDVLTQAWYEMKYWGDLQSNECASHLTSEPIQVDFHSFSFVSHFIHVCNIKCYKISKLENHTTNLWTQCTLWWSPQKWNRRKCTYHKVLVLLKVKCTSDIFSSSQNKVIHI